MENKTFDLDDWNEEYAKRYTASTVIQSLYLTVGVIGNLLVIVVYSTRMRSKNDDRYFIPILATVDLSGCVVSTTLAFIQDSYPYKYPDSILCKLITLVACNMVISSIFMLFVISIQRYQKICRPFGFQMNLKYKRIAATTALFLALALSFPIAFLYDKIEVVHPKENITGFICAPPANTKTFGDVYSGVLIVAELSSVVCMSVLYGLVGHTLITKMKPTRKNNDNKTPTSSHLNDSMDKTIESGVSETNLSYTDAHVEEKKGARIQPKPKEKRTKINSLTGKQYSMMFMVISLVSILCFFPPWVFVFLETKDKTFWNKVSYEEAQVFIIIRRLFVMNYVVNPFIYGFFDSKFRRHIWECFSLKRINLIPVSRELVVNNARSAKDP